MKKRVKIKNKITIDKLAQMVQRGFVHQSDMFDIKLRNFITKDDLKEELKRFATKDDLANLNDQMLTGFDKVLGKLDKIDQENIVHNYKHRKIDEILEFHDARIKKLEIKK